MPRLLSLGITATNMRPRLIVFGGAFDPIHNGHLYLATHAAQFFRAHVRLLPNGNPPHRQPTVAKWQHRYRMCDIAVSKYPRLSVGNDESPTAAPRYMVNTLRIIRQRRPRTALLLLVGTDAFTAMQQWHQWREIFALAHVIVANRRKALPYASPALRRRRINAANLGQGYGGVYFWNCQPPAIAARQLRSTIATNSLIDCQLPPVITDYIKKNALYRRR